jgi:GNAT superfamily N-acetyltransferase
MPRKMRPLTPKTIGEFPAECAGCAFWESHERLPRHCGAVCDQDVVNGWAESVQAQWGDCGRAAFDDGEIIGFVKYAPSALIPQARFFPAAPPSDDAVLIACLYVAEETRHLGLGKLLLHAALRDLHLRGERAVEAYAHAAPVADLPVMSIEFLLDQGFVVKRPHHEYPLLRLRLHSLATLTENVEAVLQSLQLPLRVHRPAKAPYIGTGST